MAACLRVLLASVLPVPRNVILNAIIKIYFFIRNILPLSLSCLFINTDFFENMYFRSNKIDLITLQIKLSKLS
jgi:hypothetical protein